mgnify:FL=1
MDAVKHIHTDSMKAIKEKFAKKIGVNADSIYWIQEVIGNSSEATGIQPSNYVQKRHGDRIRLQVRNEPDLQRQDRKPQGT